MNTKIIIIAGPTACGKSDVAMKVAELLNGEIISADSMQVYRTLDIGTAKPSPRERKKVRHHLIDIINPDERYSAGQFRDSAGKAITDISKEGKIPIICGGTGLYIKALTKGLAPELAKNNPQETDIWERFKGMSLESLFNELKRKDPVSAKNISPNDPQRIKRALEVYYGTGRPISEIHKKHRFSEVPYKCLFFCLKRERKELIKRIDRRVDLMVGAGLYEEAKNIFKKYEGRNINAFRAIGYREMISHIKGEITFDDAVNKVKKSTRDYAKRQMTWFRKYDEIIWIEMKEYSARDAAKFIAEKTAIFLKGKKRN